MEQPLPPELISSLQHVTGFDEAGFLAAHQVHKKVTSIRVNPFKKYYSGSTQDKVPWSTQGYYLPGRPSFTLDPAFHGGAYYVQEASSMFLEEALRQTVDLSQPLKLLDLCAAPGGKSTLIQSVISNESLLVSNELVKTRVNVLAENITKWGMPNVVVTNNQASDFQRLAGFFDVVVVDAPCSGSGLFRKDEKAINEWSVKNVTMCAARQHKILDEILPALKNSGILIYATCSYSEEENEFISDQLAALGMESLPLQLDPAWQIVETFSATHKAHGYRFYPDKLQGEGFYISVFRKPGIPGSEIKIPRNKFKQVAAAVQEKIEPYIIGAANYTFIDWMGEVLAFPASQLSSLLQLQSVLYIKKAGINMGAIKNELVPDHELAVSILLEPTAPCVELGKENALDYLRRKDIVIGNVPKGWLVVRYESISLGWIKNIGQRINNYYPKEWRILNK